MIVPSASFRFRRILAGALLAFTALPATAHAATLDLSAWRGKVVLLDFWASWCNPCRESFPWMDSAQETLGNRGLVVVAVNVDHDRQLALDFLQDNPASFKILYDPDGEVARQFRFTDMPTSYLIDRSGHVRFVHQGFYPAREGQYLSQIRELLDESSNP
jgi:thiol-disulfide isomerase/thioredoxin